MKRKLLLLCALLGTLGASIAKAQTTITNASQLSNSKAYTVVTERGTWWADVDNNIMSYKGNITSPDNVPNEDAYKFAILKQGDIFFLYSIGAGKYVCPQKYFTTLMPTAITIESVNGGKFKMLSSNPSRAINIGGSQWTWDSWTNTDGGNTLTITEVGDIDPTAALAMLTTTGVYTVSCERGTWAVTTDHTQFTGHGNENASSADVDKQFVLFTNENKMYLYSVGAEKFVKSDGTLFDGKGDPISYNGTNDGTYPYHFYFALETQIYFNMQNDGASISLNDWSGQDQGSKYKIESVTGADVDAIIAKATEVFFGTKTITYNIKINGTTVATTTREQKVGEAAALPSEYASKEYVTYSYSPSTIGTDTEEVEVTATVATLPFETSADFASAKWYNLRINETHRFVGKEATEPYHTYAEGDITEITRASMAYQWAFIGNPVTGFKVINKEAGEGQSLTSDGTANSISGATDIPNTVLRNGNHYWDIHQNGEGFSLSLIGKNNYYINTHGGATGYFQIWQAGGARTDGGSRIMVAEVPDLETTVTYNVSYNGSVVLTEEVYGVVGTALGSLPSNINRDYLTIDGFDGSTLVTRNMTVALTATWNGPFNLSADYASAHWYDMAVRGNYYVTSDNKDVNDALAPIPANAMGLAEDAYQWAFVGDPYHIKLYNKAEGNTKVYAWTSNANSSIPAFVDAASGNYWQIKQSTSDVSNAFLLTIPHDGYQVNQFGGSTGSLKIWNSTGTGDVGSAFRVFDVPDNFAEYATAEIKPYAAPTGYFAFTDAVKANIGWQDSYETSCPYNTYRDMKLALQAVDMTDLSNFNLPTTGYYRLQSYYADHYMATQVVDGNPTLSTTTDTNSPVTVVKLEAVGGNKYTISVAGLYAGTPVHDTKMVLGNTPAEFTPIINQAGSAAFVVGDDTENAIHCASSKGYDNVGWNYDAAASQWKVADASSFDLTIGSAGYSTLWVPFAVTIPSGVTAYTGSISGDYLHLNEVTGTTLPANTAVVLAGAANTYTFNITDDVTDIAGNALLGSKGNVTGGSSVYALTKPEGEEVGFYPVDGSVTIPACKAYLTVPSEVKGFTFVFDDDATGINEELRMKNEESSIYNLAGQRIRKMQKGINIVNGKKIMVK